MIEDAQVIYRFDVSYWELEQALELPYGYVLTPADVPVNTSVGFSEDA